MCLAILVGGTLRVAADPPAFPGAEGFGAVSVGGRGGAVLFVSNLNDDGHGSLRAALETPGPRTIVFAVGGIIELDRKLLIDEPFVTVAGQTAPGDGITIKNHELQIQTHDVIVRHLRVRPGDERPGERDAITLREAQRVIVDHCSASWSIDEVLSATFSDHISVQWCFITEALHQSNHHKGDHGYGALIRGGNITYHHNLFAHNRSRNPRPGQGNIDFRNNVIYHWNGLAGYGGNNEHRLNYIGNYLKPGPMTTELRHTAYTAGGPNESLYFAGNRLVGATGPILDNAKGARLVHTSFEFAPVTTEPVAVAAQRVLREAGATRPVRDAVDRRVVQEVRLEQGLLIDSPGQVGGWPSVRGGEAPTDRDHDGMPDDWELHRGLDPLDAEDRNADPDGDGYTELEHYLHHMADNPNNATDESSNTHADTFDTRWTLGELIDHEPFDGPAAMSRWVLELEKGGTVEVRDGALFIDVPGGASVWFEPVLESPVVIEFTATVVGEGGPNDRVSDLNCFWMARDSRNPKDFFAVERSGAFPDYHELQCYYVGYGGNENSTTRFRRYIGHPDRRPLLPEHDLTAEPFLIDANRSMKIRCVAAEGRAEYWRDGELIFEYADPEPYTAGRFAFRTVASHLRIDSFAVYRVAPVTD